jgi:hypothetical protein
VTLLDEGGQLEVVPPGQPAEELAHVRLVAGLPATELMGVEQDAQRRDPQRRDPRRSHRR